MAYTKQTWNTGDTITADKLNHIEEGVEDALNSPLFVTFTIQMDSTESKITNVSGNINASVVEQALADGIPVICDAIVTDSSQEVMLSNLSRMEYLEVGYAVQFTVYAQSDAYMVAFIIGILNGAYDAVSCTRYDLM